MKVLGIGESVIDKAYITDNTSAVLQDITPSTHIGGPSLIALIFLSRMGIDCTLLTSLGRDKEAKIIRKTLHHEKVHVLAKIQKKTKVNTYLIHPQTGARQKRRGDTVHPPIKNLDRKFLHQFDLIIIDRHERTAFYEIMKKKKTTTKVVIDPSTEVSQFTLDMIKYADYPVLPIEALVKFDDGHDLKESLKKLYDHCGKTITVTAGELGSILFDGEKFDIVPALQIQAVDVQGAGDIFRGGLAYGILQGWDLPKSAAFGNLVAGLQCTRLGNASAIPTRQEVDLCNNLFLTKKSLSMPTMNHYFATLQ